MSGAVAFEYLGVAWSLETAEIDVVAALSERLPPLELADPRRPVARRYSVLRGEGARGGLRILGAGRERAVADPVAAGEWIASDVCRLLSRQAAGRVFVHAGAVAWGGRALILPGASGSGKSRLVEALVRRGAVYLSDDLAVIDRDGAAHPFRRPLAKRSLDGSIERIAPTALGTAPAAPVPAAAAVFSTFAGSPGFAASELTPGAVALGLLSHALPARRSQSVQIIGRLAGRLHGLRVERGEADGAAERLLAWLDETVPAPPRPRVMLVTALYDLARLEVNPRRRRVDEYFRHGEFLMSLDADLVVFTEPELAPEIAARRAAHGLAARTHIVPLAFADLPAARELQRIERARSRNPVRNASPSKDTSRYIALCWSKFELVSRALELDPFAATHAAWIDFAIAHVARTERIGNLLLAPPARARVLRMRDFPPSAAGARRDYFAWLWGQVAAGCVAGGRTAWQRLAEAFATESARALRQGFAPSDEQLLPILGESHPDLFEWADGSGYADVLDAVSGPGAP